MTPEQETKLLDTVADIHSALVGPLGQEEEGILFRVRNHETRLGRLENWRWYIVGIFSLAVLVAELLAASSKR